MLPEGAGCYRKLLVATERGWLLHEAFGCYRKVMVATGSFWLLHEGDGCYEKLVAPVHRKLQDAKEVVKLRSKKCSELSSDYFSLEILYLMRFSLYIE